MTPWNSVTLDVLVDVEDFEETLEADRKGGKEVKLLTVQGEVDLDDAIDEATVEQLRDALGREEQGYTLEQIDAIRDCFEALTAGNVMLAEALLPRIFEHEAQIRAAQAGLRTLHRNAA